jgi:hypothetical protein
MDSLKTKVCANHLPNIGQGQSNKAFISCNFRAARRGAPPDGYFGLRGRIELARGLEVD